MTDLDRFVQAQAGRHGTTLDQAVAELQVGRKTSHWTWFVLPQLRVLSRSQMARAYGIADLAQAQAYAAHPVHGPRLVTRVRAMLSPTGKSAESILGPVDALKFRSCLTLFEKAAPDEPLWGQALGCSYGGQRDQATLAALVCRDAAPD
jgi:uncharacterized protein (DUF1810 family)